MTKEQYVQDLTQYVLRRNSLKTKSDKPKKRNRKLLWYELFGVIPMLLSPLLKSKKDKN